MKKLSQIDPDHRPGDANLLHLRARAKAHAMGEKFLTHPANRVQRGAHLRPFKAPKK